MIKNELKQAFRIRYNISSDGDNDLNEYVLEYIAAAQVAAIIYWIKNDLIVPLKEISELMQTLANDGVLKRFENK